MDKWEELRSWIKDYRDSGAANNLDTETFMTFLLSLMDVLERNEST